MCAWSSSSLTNKWDVTWLLYPCRPVLTFMIPHMAKTHKIARKRERRLQACQSIIKTPFLRPWNPKSVHYFIIRDIKRYKVKKKYWLPTTKGFNFEICQDKRNSPASLDYSVPSPQHFKQQIKYHCDETEGVYLLSTAKLAKHSRKLTYILFTFTWSPWCKRRIMQVITYVFLQVQEIHILCETNQDPSFIRALALSMDWKLVFLVLGRRMRYKDAFQYASQTLLGKCTMIINADCYIDKGFEYLTEDLLSLKTLYALTRHETSENVNFCKKIDFCGPNSKYIGSHDAWLFKLLEPVPSVLLENIDFRPNIAGIERVLIFYLRKYGRFRIKNPCKILHIVHHHCNRNKNTKERLFYGQRIDHHFKITALNRGRTVNAPFSDL